MALYLITGPTTEPVTLQEAKEHARIEIGDDNAYIEGLITAARASVEVFTGLQLFTATWKLALDSFPCGRIDLPQPPLQSVSGITYVDTAGSTQTLDPTLYRVLLDPQGGYVEPAYGQVWPSARSQAEAVNVTFVSGWSTVAAAPAQAKLAIKLLVATWYENRENVVTGTIVQDFPWAVEKLLRQIRVWSFA